MTRHEENAQISGSKTTNYLHYWNNFVIKHAFTLQYAFCSTIIGKGLQFDFKLFCILRTFWSLICFEFVYDSSY